MNELWNKIQHKKKDQDTDNKSAKPESTKKLSKQQVLIRGGILAAVMIFLDAFLLMDTVKVAAMAAPKAFNEGKAEVEEQVYQDFYTKSFNAAEKAHHVENKVNISIGDLEEKQSLEVLKIVNLTYKGGPEEKDQAWYKDAIDNVTGVFDEEPTIYLQVPGKGVFTVNLKAGEYIVDNTHEYVLARVPEPELTQFTIDYVNVDILAFKDGGLLKKPAKYGEEKAEEALKEAELELMQEANNNQEYYKRAVTSAENIIANLIKQLNPDIPNLTVEVEFIN